MTDNKSTTNYSCKCGAILNSRSSRTHKCKKEGIDWSKKNIYDGIGRSDLKAQAK